MRRPAAVPALPAVLLVLLAGGAIAQQGSLPPGDFQYFLPQEFLLDLPIRDGSFASEVMRMLQTLDFQDVHAKDVDNGVFESVYATSDLNAPAYKAARKICTKVPPGYNKQNDPSLCESEGATAPQAIINSPTPGVAYSEGNFQIVAEFDIDLRGYLHVWTQTCVVLCWENQLCNDDITLTGSFRVVSSVEVVRDPTTGQISLLPSTQFDFTRGPYTYGCREDWIASFFANVDNELSAAVGTLVQKWVANNLQKQIQMKQHVHLLPSVSLTYQIVKLDFVPDWQSKNERGYVRVHAITTVFATAPNGTQQSFPDNVNSWTGYHNPVPLKTHWQRRVEREGSETVLLGGVRFSQEMLTMLFQGLHYAGVLSPHDTSKVHDAQVLSHVEMLQPTVHIEAGGKGALLVEPSLSVSVACPDRSDAPGSGLFRILDATFSGVMQRVLVSAFVAKDHSSMGLTLQLSDISLSAANMTAFSSSTLFGSEGHFKAMAERVLKSAMPKVNRRLASAPVVFCGGGGSSCALVPFVPHPEVRAVPGDSAGGSGFVQLSWACSCSSGGRYQQCQGFLCHGAPAGGAETERRLRGHGEAAGRGLATGLSVLPQMPRVVSGVRRLGLTPSLDQSGAHSSDEAGHNATGAIYLSTYAPVGPESSGGGTQCSFSTLGSTLGFGALRATLGCVPAPPGSEALLGQAYHLERLEGGRFSLHVGCDLRCSGACRHKTGAVRLQECGALAPAAPLPGQRSVPFMLSRVFSERPEPQAAPLAGALAPPPAPAQPPVVRGCVGGQEAYSPGDVLLLGVRASTSADALTPFTHAVHLSDAAGGPSKCVPCGSTGDLWCKAEPVAAEPVAAAEDVQHFRAWLLCKGCPSGVPTGCLLGGSSDSIALQAEAGKWFGVSGNASGYSRVTLVTQHSLPVLQPCPRPAEDDTAAQAALPIPPALAAGVAGIVAAVLVLVVKGRGKGATPWASPGKTCAQLGSELARLAPELRLVPPGDSLQSKVHGLLWVGAALLCGCGLVWLLENPLVSLLAEVRTTTGVDSGFNDEAAEAIVERSRYIGLAIFAAFSALLATLSVSMIVAVDWPWFRHLNRAEEQALIKGYKHGNKRGEEARPLWSLGHWYTAAAFLLSESNSGIAFLAFCLWRDTHGDFTLMGGDTYAGDTATAIFSIRLLLAWIAPFLLVTHSVPAAALGAYARGLAAAGHRRSPERRRLASGSQPFALASVLVHASIELILSIVYYRSGYGKVSVLYLVLAGVVLNVLAFLAISPPREAPVGETGVPSEDGCCSTIVVWTLAALQWAGTVALLVCLADGGCWPFLVASWVTASYLAWASTQVFMEAASVEFEDEAPAPVHSPALLTNVHGSDTEDTEEDVESKARMIHAIAVSPAMFLAWLLERNEAKDKLRYGARIKWRRLCLLMGSASLIVSASKVVTHNAAVDPWEDVSSFLDTLAGPGVVISRDQASVFEPLVERYGQARTHHMICIIVGALLFAVAAALDIFSSGSPRLLKACRLSGFLGTLAYLMGMLIGNMPDYVGMLDFKPTLGRCGSDFCNAVATSMRAAFGAALLAQSGAMFIPVLVSLPWTLGRIGFFLSADSANTRAVAALTWGTLTCMLRLSILPATVAFVYRPVAQVAVWYVAFLLAPSVFLIWIVVTRRTNLLWYLLWGWAFFLVPLLAMGSVAMEEGMWPLWCRIFRGLFSEANWPNSLAEFTLSDVVISDMFFMIL